MNVVARGGDHATGRRVATAAPPGRRLAAELVDLGVVLLVVALVLASAGSVSGALRALWVTVAGIAAIAIVVVNEFVLVTRRGQSVGKRLLGIQIVDSHTMVPPRGRQVVLRNLFKYGLNVGIPWRPFAGAPMIVLGPWPIICFASAIADRSWHRGPHDRGAHTVVIDVHVDDDGARS